MARIGVNLRVTGHCSQGGRKYMEDMFAVAYQQTVDMQDLEYAFCGIFDGHGGPQAAIYAKDHLLDSVVTQKNFWSDNDEDILRAIHDGFITTHYDMWKDLDKWPRASQGLPSTSGTTATIAFIMKGKIYIGHAGDTCIVLGLQEEGETQWKAEPLTQDHKPENRQELERIERAGGKVVNKAGVNRVVWNRPQLGHQGPVRRSTAMDEIPFLAVARSLGDFWSYNSRLDQFVVSPEPDVSVFTVDIKRHKCLIFGTDGLWNILSPEHAVSLVQKTESHNERQNHKMANWLNPSKCLVDKAMEKWKSSNLRADNTSVVVLLLDPPGPPNSNVLINRGNTLFYSTQHSNQSTSDLPMDDSDEVPRSGGLAIYTHYLNPNVPPSMSSSSSENQNEDHEESDDDDEIDEEDDDLNEDSENEDSDNNDGPSEHSVSEGYSSLLSNYSSFENADTFVPASPISTPTSSISSSSSDNTCHSSQSPSAQQYSNQKISESAPTGTILHNLISPGSGDLLKSSSKCRKRLSESELVIEESSSSDVENESVFIDNKRRRLTIEKPTNNNWKKPLTPGGSNDTENNVCSGEWFVDNTKPRWKKAVKPLALEGSSHTENDTSTGEWFVDKKRNLSLDKKSSKPNWQKPLPAGGKINTLKEKPLDETKRTLRSDTSAAMRVKTLRSRNVDLKSSCNKDSVMKMINSKREGITTGVLLNKQIDGKSVKEPQINSGRFRTKKVSSRWTRKMQSKQYKSTRSHASRGLRK